MEPSKLPRRDTYSMPIQHVDDMHTHHNQFCWKEIVYLYPICLVSHGPSPRLKSNVHISSKKKEKPNVHVPSSMVYTSISDEIRVERCGQSLTDRCPQHLTARQDWLRLESWIRVTRWCQGRTIQTTTCSYLHLRRSFRTVPNRHRVRLCINNCIDNTAGTVISTESYRSNTSC